MKYILIILISVTIFKIGYEQCFSEKPSSVDVCTNKKRDGYKCCFVEYKNNKMSDYDTVCLEIVKDDIKSGHHEATIIDIEGGNYTGSNWDETVMEKFRDYATISNFDCKGSYIFKSLVLLSSLLLIL